MLQYLSDFHDLDGSQLTCLHMTTLHEVREVYNTAPAALTLAGDHYKHDRLCRKFCGHKNFVGTFDP